MTLGLREQHKYQNFRNLITINCKWWLAWGLHYRWLCQFCWICSTRIMIFLRRIFITYLSSRYSVIVLRFTSQLLSLCDLWSECGSEVTGLRKIIWDLLFLSYSSNLMFVAIVPTALALIIFVSLSWVKNWAIKSQCDKNKGIYPWFKLDETCVTTIAKCTILFTYHSYGVVHILRCQDFGIFWPPTKTLLRKFLYYDKGKSTYRWHLQYIPPTYLFLST